MEWAAWLMASRPEAHTLLSVVALAEVGSPAAIDACLAGACPTPAWITWPMITSSTLDGSTFERSTAALMAIDPSCGEGIEARLPIILPIGVRAAPRM